VYCEDSYSPKFASPYIFSMDFVCTTVALYGLIALYELCKKDLAGIKPLGKFMGIK
jgi:hypothetical protein